MSVGGVAGNGNAGVLVIGQNVPHCFANGQHNIALPQDWEFIPQAEVAQILNNIQSHGPHGQNVLQALVQKLDEHQIQIALIKYSDNAPEDIRNYNNNYAFKSEAALGNTNPIYVAIKSPPPEAEKRFVFDGTEIKEQIITSRFLNNKNLEAYLISHELAHVVSFLSSGITDANAWNTRKQNWSEFLKESRMKPIYNALHDQGLSDQDIHDSFQRLFTNTEEARNLLGVIPGQNEGEYIGEFYLFNEHNNYELLTYLDKDTPLTDCDRAVLNAIAAEFHIAFQSSGGCLLL
jgi:hypothetical protein